MLCEGLNKILLGPRNTMIIQSRLDTAKKLRMASIKEQAENLIGRSKR